MKAPTKMKEYCESRPIYDADGKRLYHARELCRRHKINAVLLAPAMAKGHLHAYTFVGTMVFFREEDFALWVETHRPARSEAV